MNCPYCKQGVVTEEPCEVCQWHPEQGEPAHHPPDGHEPFDLGGE